ncbi:MAG: hypothetical protein K6D91_01815 [Prevotella sp.]|nr:hypothetical protein [Prevotella sp.]
MTSIIINIPNHEVSFFKKMITKMVYAPRCGTCSARSSLMENGWDGPSLHNTSSIIVFT